MSANHICPNCGAERMSIFYELKNVPVHSVLLLATREEALNCPKGDIVLGFCHLCGFITNVAFDAGLHEYSSRYEGTQGFSPTFNTFHRKLAKYLVEQYDLRGKDIIEIGCGQGEFLTLLCELGGNRGVGFDPAHSSERNGNQSDDRITFIEDFYSEKYDNYRCDFLCCKMTLEHIKPTAEFVRIVRRSIADNSNTFVFFQVPNVMRILRELAFWDIYYEHCSYFYPGSLVYLFRRYGFDVIDLWKDYDDQYLMIVARPRKGQSRLILSQEDELEDQVHDVANFTEHYQLKLNKWQRDLQRINQIGQRAVVWGAGSKGVAFLTTLNIQDEIKYVVDINPYKNEMYMAGTGQQIVAPEFLREYKPDVLIVMNPIYCNEIQRDLNQMGITTELMPV